MIIRGIIFIIIFLNFFPVASVAKTDAPVAVKGILDLRTITDMEHTVVDLNGDWEFYWKEMLYPDDFKKDSLRNPYYGKVPSYWTDYPQDEIKTTKYGYATYRLVVLLPANLNTTLAVDLPVFDSSYEIFLNGKKMGGKWSSRKISI